MLAVAFQNGMEYRNADGRVNNAINWPTACKKLVNFGPVTCEITWLICVHL